MTRQYCNALVQISTSLSPDLTRSASKVGTHVHTGASLRAFVCVLCVQSYFGIHLAQLANHSALNFSFKHTHLLYDLISRQKGCVCVRVCVRAWMYSSGVIFEHKMIFKNFKSYWDLRNIPFRMGDAIQTQPEGHHVWSTPLTWDFASWHRTSYRRQRSAGNKYSGRPTSRSNLLACPVYSQSEAAHVETIKRQDDETSETSSRCMFSFSIIYTSRPGGTGGVLEL